MKYLLAIFLSCLSAHAIENGRDFNPVATTAYYKMDRMQGGKVFDAISGFAGVSSNFNSTFPSPIITNGGRGSVLWLSNSNWISIATNSAWDFSGNKPFMICFWINPITSLAGKALISKTETNNTCEWSIDCASSANKMELSIYDQGATSPNMNFTNGIMPPTAKWTHIAACYLGGTNGIIFSNGVPFSCSIKWTSGPVTNIATSGAVTIGAELPKSSFRTFCNVMFYGITPVRLSTDSHETNYIMPMVLASTPYH